MKDKEKGIRVLTDIACYLITHDFDDQHGWYPVSRVEVESRLKRIGIGSGKERE